MARGSAGKGAGIRPGSLPALSPSAGSNFCVPQSAGGARRNFTRRRLRHLQRGLDLHRTTLGVWRKLPVYLYTPPGRGELGDYRLRLRLRADHRASRRGRPAGRKSHKHGDHRNGRPHTCRSVVEPGILTLATEMGLIPVPGALHDVTQLR